MIAETPVGQRVEVEVLRKGSSRTFHVELSKRKDTDLVQPGVTPQKQQAFGIGVSNLTPETARQFNLKDAEGVIVVNVEPDSAGEKAGVLPGDIIREINHEEVDDVAAYEKEIGKIKSGETVYFCILRGGRGVMVVKLTK